MNSKLVISSIKLDMDEVIVKSHEKKLTIVASSEESIKVDLSNLTEGTHKVPVFVSGADERLSYTSRTTVIKVKITKKK